MARTRNRAENELRIIADIRKEREQDARATSWIVKYVQPILNRTVQTIQLGARNFGKPRSRAPNRPTIYIPRSISTSTQTDLNLELLESMIDVVVRAATPEKGLLPTTRDHTEVKEKLEAEDQLALVSWKLMPIEEETTPVRSHEFTRIWEFNPKQRVN